MLTARRFAPPAAPQVQKKGAEDAASNEALGRSRGGFSTKLHLLCDSHGHPLHACLSPGQAHESQSLEELLEGCDVRGDEQDEPIWPVFLAGDKGYRAEWIDEYLLEQGILPVIPSKKGEDRSARLVERMPPHPNPLREARRKLPGHGQNGVHSTILENHGLVGFSDRA